MHSRSSSLTAQDMRQRAEDAAVLQVYAAIENNATMGKREVAISKGTYFSGEMKQRLVDAGFSVGMHDGKILISW